MPIPERGESMESYSALKQLAKVNAGFKGGNRFSNPVTIPVFSIVNAWPAKTTQQLQAKK